MSMHFSLIQPHPQHEREAAYERTRGAYEDHQWLWQRFFPAPRGTPRDFLFRRLDAGVAARFHVVSARPPCEDVPGWQVQTKAYEPRLSAGDRLRFELRANPVVSRPGEALLDAAGAPRQRATGRHAGAPQHKIIRHDVVMDAKQRLLAERGLDRWQDWQGYDKPQLYDLARKACSEWLIKQGLRRGFEVDLDALQVDAYTQHRGKNDRLRFSSVDFAGELIVRDPSTFGESLIQGIGHAKAFGCGLLLVRRLG
jgi:CRISPR system Cascade subunit CasE